MSDKRSFGLDIIRAFAIIMVVFSHSVVVLANLIPLLWAKSLKKGHYLYQ
jgi:peptidoglycan/LPS O-acetylase OafA/YrhL